MKDGTFNKCAMGVVASGWLSVIVGGAMVMGNDEYPLCEDTGQTTACADYHGDGITIDGERYYSCDLTDEKPCFTYRLVKDGTDYRLFYRLHS